MKIREVYIDYNPTETIEIIDAKYLSDYKIICRFNDGTENEIDFKSFLTSSKHPSIKRYLEKKVFQKFEIINGNLNWNDYDLIFPVDDLLNGTI